MQLTLWSYEGPPHVGAMRVATAMNGVHLLLHAPQGDTYADLLFTMIERRDKRPPVSYTSFQARNLGNDTSALVTESIRRACEIHKPQVLMIAESCTAELLQDQPGAFAEGMDLDVPVLSLELPAYTRKETWGANETFFQLVRGLLGHLIPEPGAPAPERPADKRPSANLLGPIALGFRHRDDVIEITRLLDKLGVDVNLVAPLGASAVDLMRIPEADFNICLYPEFADQACRWLERMFKMPTVRTVPIGIGATHQFIREVADVAGVDISEFEDPEYSRLPWFSRSVDSTYLTGKRVFLFGDATHVMTCARIAAEEMGFTIVGLGTYSREFARDIRELATKYDVEALITDDYLEVERQISELNPELVLGTQMERHVSKRLGVPCAVISAPVHIQDFPSRYSPQMGFEGANVIFDTWIRPLMMGLEEHLINMFSDDFEFHEAAQPSHLGGGVVPLREVTSQDNATAAEPEVATDVADAIVWVPDAEKELKKIPFFVRGKARRNTELFAQEQGIETITVETLYDAKAHFGR